MGPLGAFWPFGIKNRYDCIFRQKSKNRYDRDFEAFIKEILHNYFSAFAGIKTIVERRPSQHEKSTGSHACE